MGNLRIRRESLLLSVLILALVGCGKSNNEHPHHVSTAKIEMPFSGKYPIRIVCTTGMVADLVRNIGGEHVAVMQMMGDGVDPHLYKASPGDVSQLSQADAIFYSGLHLEGKMTDIFERMARKKPTIAVTDAIPQSQRIGNDGNSFDPHVWFDVSLWSEAAGVVRDRLKEFDPPHAETYQARADSYLSELAVLHDDTKAKLQTIPKERRVLVTAHDAFRYFGRAYDLEVMGIQGISTESEAGLKDVNDLVAFLVERKIKAVFVESSVPDKNVRALLEGCRARGHDIAIGGELYSDAMGKPGTPAGTYTGMVRHNVDTIVKALK
jgi:manganese/zinc/iron transport system substrate-binding protein